MMLYACVWYACRDTQQWLLHGTPRGAPSFLRGANAVVWARDYSHTVHERCDCDTLQSVLKVGLLPQL